MTVMRAPLSFGQAVGDRTMSSLGPQGSGAQIRTSMPKQGSGHQQRVGRVVAGVTDVAIGDLLKRLAASGPAWSACRPASASGATGR